MERTRSLTEPVNLEIFYKKLPNELWVKIIAFLNSKTLLSLTRSDTLSRERCLASKRFKLLPDIMEPQMLSFFPKIHDIRDIGVIKSDTSRRPLYLPGLILAFGKDSIIKAKDTKGQRFIAVRYLENLKKENDFFSKENILIVIFAQIMKTNKWEIIGNFSLRYWHGINSCLFTSMILPKQINKLIKSQINSIKNLMIAGKSEFTVYANPCTCFTYTQSLFNFSKVAKKIDQPHFDPLD